MEIEIWHPIDGKWVHIVQITKADIRQYFTDGKLIMTKEVLKDAFSTYLDFIRSPKEIVFISKNSKGSP